jgi:hypothetical protein
MKKLLFIISILTIFSTKAQYKKAELHFRDGTIKKGLAKHPFASSKLKYKVEEESDPVIYSYKKVDRFFFTTEEKGDEVKTEYQYKIVVRQVTPKLMEVYLRGRISLYGIEKTNSGYGMAMGGFGGSGGGVAFSAGVGGTSTTYYLGKIDSDVVEKVSSKEKLSFRRFKKIVLKHFKNCNELVEKTKNKNKYLRKETIFSIVKFYNKNCKN